MLVKKIIRGGGWMLGLRSSKLISYVLKVLLLGRLLGPENYGVVSILLLILTSVEMLTHIDIQQAFVQKKIENKESYSQLFSFNVVRGIFVALLLFILRSQIAQFLHIQEYEHYLIFVSFAIVLQSLVNPRNAILYINLDYRRIFFIQGSSVFIDLFVTLLFVIITGDPVGIVWGLLAGRVVLMSMSYKLNHFVPKFGLRFSDIKKPLLMGMWIYGSTILVYLLTNLDDILVTRYYGIVAIGLYQMAYAISNTPATELTAVVSSVLFPAYSKLNDDKKKLTRAFQETFTLNISINIFISFSIVVFISSFVAIFLGSEWKDVIIYTQLLAVYGLFRSIGGMSGALFIAIGKARLRMYLQLFQFLGFLVLLIPAVLSNDMILVILSVIVNSLIFNVIAMYFVSKNLDLTAFDLIKISSISVISGLIYMLLINVLISAVVPNNLMTFMLLIIISTVIYMMIFYIIDKMFGSNQVVQFKRRILEAKR